MNYEKAYEKIVQVVSSPETDTETAEYLTAALSALYFQIGGCPEISGEHWACPYCKKVQPIEKENPRFCPECGMRMKWDEGKEIQFPLKLRIIALGKTQKDVLAALKSRGVRVNSAEISKSINAKFTTPKFKVVYSKALELIEEWEHEAEEERRAKNEARRKEAERNEATRKRYSSWRRD